MNKHEFDNCSLGDRALLVPVSAEELRLVAGGGRIWNAIKSAAKWVYNQVVPNRIVPLPIKF